MNTQSTLEPVLSPNYVADWCILVCMHKYSHKDTKDRLEITGHCHGYGNKKMDEWESHDVKPWRGKRDSLFIKSFIRLFFLTAIVGVSL